MKYWLCNGRLWSLALRKKDAPARKQPREVPAADTLEINHSFIIPNYRSPNLHIVIIRDIQISNPHPTVIKKSPQKKSVKIWVFKYISRGYLNLVKIILKLGKIIS